MEILADFKPFRYFAFLNAVALIAAGNLPLRIKETEGEQARLTVPKKNEFCNISRQSLEKIARHIKLAKTAKLRGK